MKKLSFLLVLVALMLTIIAGCSQNSSGTNQESSNNQTGNNQNEAASDFPEKPIQLIVPFAAGGGTDTIARTMERYVSKYLPNEQPIVIVNKAGGSGSVGNTDLFFAEPDGHTIGILTIDSVAVQPHFGTTEYTHDSFSPITRLISEPMFMVVKQDAPWNSFEEWFEYVKQNPGEFKFATAGPGSTAHIIIESMNSVLDIETGAIPYEGSAPGITALIGGDVDASMGTYPEIRAQLEAGTIKVLFNAGTREHEILNDVPLVKDLGYDVGLDAFFVLAAPKDVPEERLKVLHDAFEKTLKDPELLEKFDELGFSISYAGPEETQQMITDSYESIVDVLKAAGLIE